MTNKKDKKYNAENHYDFQIEKIDKMGDPLIGLREHINWEAFRKDLAVISNKLKRSNAGAPPFDCVFMLKILILQQLNNLSDDKTEFMIRDRLTYQRFLAIEPGDRIPDAKTIWVFRNTLKTLKLHDKLLDRAAPRVQLPIIITWLQSNRWSIDRFNIY